jgi:hypothetical protein
MGGPGSGNHYHWWRSSKKTVVEDCRSLDANRWMREGILQLGIHRSGSWAWFRDASLKEQTSAIDYEVNTLDVPPWVRLFYTFTQSKDAIDYRIRLVTTEPRFGGLRWWFICSLSLNGRACGRRVRKLYLPPGGRYFGCRHCYNLTYRSAQEHDKRVDALRRNPHVLMDLMEDPSVLSISQLGLALKALRPGNVRNRRNGRPGRG